MEFKPTRPHSVVLTTLDSENIIGHARTRNTMSTTIPDKDMLISRKSSIDDSNIVVSKNVDGRREAVSEDREDLDVHHICLLGGHVGKTSVLLKFLGRDVDPLPTNSVATIDAVVNDHGVVIHDTSGYLEFVDSDFKNCIKNSDAFIFFFSYESKESLEIILLFHEMILSNNRFATSKYPCILVGTFGDSPNRIISEEDARSFAHIIEAEFFEISTLANNVTNLFERIDNMIKEKKKAPRINFRKISLSGVRPRLDLARQETMNQNVILGMGRARRNVAPIPEPVTEEPHLDTFFYSDIIGTKNHHSLETLVNTDDFSLILNIDDIVQESEAPKQITQRNPGYSIKDELDSLDYAVYPKPSQSVKNSVGKIKSGSKKIKDLIVNTNEILHEGYMLKTQKSSQKKRWFCLTDKDIFYYTKNTKKTIKGKVILHKAELEITDIEVFKFEIITPDRIWNLKCYSKSELDEWMKKIKETTCKEANFGIDLNTVVNRALERGSTLRVPVMVQKMITYLRERNALKKVGLFRISGNDSQIKELKEKFDYEVDEDQVIDAGVHCVACTLKLYFRELPEPIIHGDIQNRLLGIHRTEDEERIQRTKEILQELHPNNYATLEYIISYLREVVDNHTENKMGIDNISIVFGPTLIRYEIDDPLKQFSIMKFQQSCISDLLHNYHQLFHKPIFN